MFEELWKIIQVHYAAKRYHLVLGNIRLLIPLFDRSQCSNQPYIQNVLKELQGILIYLDTLAHEFHFRDYLHRCFITPIYKKINQVDMQVAESFLQHLTLHMPRSDIGRVPYAKYEHTFQMFYNLEDQDPNKQLRLARGQRIALLEANPAHNQYIVWNEVVLSYLDAQLCAGKGVQAQQLTALLNCFEATLAKIEKAYQTIGTEVIAKELWHDVFIAQRLLSNRLAQASLGEALSWEVLSNWWQAHQSQAAGLFLLLVIAEAIELHREEGAAFYTLAKQINTQLSTHLPCHQTAVFANYSLTLQTIRDVFKTLSPVFSLITPQSLVKAQQQFTHDTLSLLNQFVQNTATLLGEAPCNFALCALGSTSREDRRPYSDVELVLLYRPKAQVNSAHLQTYLYYLICGVELAIKQCGESHKEHADPSLLQSAGFHLDDSSHLLKKKLVGTPEEIAHKFIMNITQSWEEEGHPWLNDESFYSLLSPVLINTDTYGGEQVISEYQALIQIYLNEVGSAADNLPLLTQSLKLTAPLSFNGLKRREVIALSCLIEVMQKSKAVLTSLTPGLVVDDIKSAFYKPLTYLALNLKLFYGLSAKHPAEILAEAANKLSWGESQVAQLFQTVLGYITHIQVKLHLQHGHQEERIIWLGSANHPLANQSTQISVLSPEEYAGLSLIKEGLLLPLCTWLEEQFKTQTSSFKLIEVLPYLFKSYLATRNERWLNNWIQQATHALSFTELLAHPLIKMLADYSSPHGWSPTYAGAMHRWLEELQTLTTNSKTPCLMEGIPTLNPKQTIYLPTDIISQLFDTQGEFKGNVHDSKESKVSCIRWPAADPANSKVFYFKVKPGNEAGLMGREFAVINLHQLLGGASHIALGWPLKLTYMTDKGAKIYYCWVSEGIPGKSLAEVMQAEADFTHFKAQLGMQSYSHLFVTHYLTCPEDAQPDNFKVDATPAGTFRLYGLDVGQSFVGTYDETRQVLTVKSMLYLLEGAIDKPLDAAVLTRLRLLAPQALLAYWQTNCEQINQHFRPLFEAELKKTRVPPAKWGKHNQLIDLTDAIKRCVQLRLELLLNWLYGYSSHPKTGLRLLKDLDKALAFRYQSLRGKVKTPADFYQKLDPKAYKLSEAKTVGRGKVISTTTYNQIKQNSLTPERLQRSLDFDETYFAHIDFSKLQDPAEQVFVLKMLQTAIDRNKPFTYLNLSGCTVINEQELFALLQKTPALKTLHLANCPQFNLVTIYKLLSIKLNEKLVGFFRWDYDVLCPQLKTLRVTVEGKVHQLTLAASLTSRQQLLAFTAQWQTHFNRYLAKLLTSLKDKEFEVRAAAYAGLAALAPSVSEAQVIAFIQTLQALLKEYSWRIRQEACHGLVAFAPSLTEAQVIKIMQSLQAELKANHQYVRLAACKGLVALASSLTEEQKIEVMQTLQVGLQDKDSDVRQAACQGLVALAPSLPETQVINIMQMLQAELKDEYSSVRQAACQGLVALAPSLPETQVINIMQSLQAGLKDRDSYVRQAACKGLVALAPRLTQVQVMEIIKTLQAGLKNEYSSIIREAVYQGLVALALRLTQVQVMEVIKTLQVGLKNEYLSVLREAAYQGLVALALSLPEAQVIKIIRSLYAELKDNDWDMAYQGLVALAPRLTQAQVMEVIQTLQARLKNKYPRVREAAYQGLVVLAPRLTQAQVIEVIQTLQTGLKDYDWDVRVAACQCLVALAPSVPEAQVIEVIQTLQAELKDSNSKVREAACQVLVALAPSVPKTQVIEVMQSLQAGLKDTDWDVREAAYECLVALVPRLTEVQVIVEVMQILQAGLKDNDWYVRKAACQWLIMLVQGVAAAQANSVTEKLLLLINDKHVDVRVFVLKNLANVYAFQIQLRLLKRAIVNSHAVTDVETLADQLFDLSTQQKIFSFLDQDTLFRIIPCIDKEWQRWQQVYLQRQGELLRAQKSSMLNDDSENFQTAFQYFLQPAKVKIATESVPVKPSNYPEAHNNLTFSSDVVPKKVNLAQTVFFAKPTPSTGLSKHYKVQIDQQFRMFEVQAVAGDGECAYTAFGITRAQAYQLLIKHLNEIRPFIKPALQEALRTQAFFNWLESSGRLTQTLSQAYAHYIQASQGEEMPQSVLDALDSAGEDLTILLAYIDYDVKEKHIDAGWSHPCILFALAEIQKIELHIWQETSQGELIPHPYYAQHISTQATQRTDLLFVNGNHFERLEPIEGPELASEISNTNVFSPL